MESKFSDLSRVRRDKQDIRAYEALRHLARMFPMSRLSSESLQQTSVGITTEASQNFQLTAKRNSP